MLAAIAFVVFLTAFAWELAAYQRKVVGWAKRDLDSRVRLTAANLSEPLRTQDIRRIHAIGDELRDEGLRLRVRTAAGGRFYDSFAATGDTGMLWAQTTDDEYVIGIGVSDGQVFAPFRRALIGVSLAGLVGIAGVLLFFFITYRQRVRIRELAKLERFRREFIADVSHEIRTPLTGILGAVDMMDVSSPLVELAKKESVRLNALVQSILDLARLEREGDLLDRAETDLAGLVREIADRYGCECVVKDPCTAKIDARLVGQAIENLVVNAVRHSGSKEITLGLSVVGREASVSVEDHGIGIPPDERERVFERFHRLDPSRSAETGGAGLGLAIVRRIARLHGGEVVLTEAKPHGCRFTFSIKMV